MDHDTLIGLLKARAADPKRRTELELGPIETARRTFGRFFSVDRPMDVAAAEAALSVAFPPLLARVYTEVGNGGFGPGAGLLSLERLVRETRELRSGAPLPRNRAWPADLVTVVERSPGWTCVDTRRDDIVEWDPEDLEEFSSEARFRKSFAVVAPSVEAWLERWVRSKVAADRNKPSRREREARLQARAQSPEAQARQARKARAAIEQLSPEDRARWGLDDLFREDEPG